MKKFLNLLLLVLALTIANFTFATTLTGNVEFTVDSARIAALDGVDKKIDMLQFEKLKKDSLKESNLDGIKDKIYFLGDNSTDNPSRFLTPFYFGRFLLSYGVRYAADPKHSYYYDRSGNLLMIDIIDKTDGSYPNKCLSYLYNGNLKRSTLNVSNLEQYVYRPNGSLIAHWVGNRAYNEDGKKMSITRTLPDDLEEQ